MAGAPAGEPDVYSVAVAAERVSAPSAAFAAGAVAPTADFAQHWPAVVPLAGVPAPAAAPTAGAPAVVAHSASAAVAGIADPGWHFRCRAPRAADVEEDPSHVPERC